MSFHIYKMVSWDFLANQQKWKYSKNIKRSIKAVQVLASLLWQIPSESEDEIQIAMGHMVKD